MRESKCNAIILKKQPFNEADEIITFFTREQGKVRALAKSVKLAKSKLQARLQTLFLVNITLAGNKLPKIIGAEIVEVYENLRADLAKVNLGFFASELIMKFTADEQKNEALFNELENFLSALNKQSAVSKTLLVKFKLDVLKATGFGVGFDSRLAGNQKIVFNPSSGNFEQSKSGLGLIVSAPAFELFQGLDNGVESLAVSEDAVLELNRLLSGFIEYQLERKIKSEKYL